MTAHILILGGSSGIGLASARQLLEQGATVTLCARNRARLEAAVGGLEAGQPGRVRYLVADGMDEAQVRDAVALACDEQGQLQGAVAVPGGGGFCVLTELRAEQMRDELAANTVPLLNLIQAAIPRMPEGGSLVAISSIAAFQSSRGLSSYCAGKAALEGFLRVAADELGARNIRLNGVRPGLTRTNATSGMFASPEVMAKFPAQIPLGRVGEPDDVAAAVTFLLGPQANWMTGQFITADGGHGLRAFPELF